MYDNGAMESYMTEDSMESAALMKGNHKQKVGGFCAIQWAWCAVCTRLQQLLKWDPSLQPSQDVLASYVSDTYPMVERKGPITQKALDRFAEADMDDEYCALSFNNDPEYLVRDEHDRFKMHIYLHRTGCCT